MTDTVGRQFSAASGVDGLLELEVSNGRRERFAGIEKLATAVIVMSFTGKPPVKIGGVRGATTMKLQHLPAGARTTVVESFDLAGQQGRGAWWLPEDALLKAGSVNVPAYYATAPRFAMNAAAADTGRVAFAGCPDAVACWALLIPFANVITAPLMLRGPESGMLDPAARDAAWAQVDSSYGDLGLLTGPVSEALSAMRPGNGWSRLSSREQVAIRQRLVTAVGAAVTTETAGRWRAVQVLALLDRYYTKARKEQPTAQAVLTKAFQATVAAWFGGDWLAVLDYLGEQPAPGEQVTTALPEPRLYVQASAKVEQVAADKHLPVEAVAQMLASYLGTEEIRSPVQRRVEVLRAFWDVFDAAHAAQQPGMRPLTGLVGERWLAQGQQAPFRTPAYEHLVHPAMLADIETLWGGECFPRYPDRIVSTLFPHAQMAETFGPALSLWHNVAVTAWFFCEGPYSRTDLNGMAEYYRQDVEALAAGGTPINPALFRDLKTAQKRLGRPQQIWRERSVHEVAPDITFETAFGGGERRDGFEILREIITAHRRTWAAQYLDAALRQAWERELRNTARELNRILAGKGKLPTVKQFAKLGAPVANAWFGGDLSAMYVAIGERPPLTQQRVRLMPYDRVSFCNRLFAEFGGRFVPNSRASDDPNYTQSWSTQRVVQEAPRFVQLEELLDRPPTAAEFRAEKYDWPDGLDFDRYAAAVGHLREAFRTVRSPRVQRWATGAPTPFPAHAVGAESAAPQPATWGAGAATQGADQAAPTAGPIERKGLLRRLIGRR